MPYNTKIRFKLLDIKNEIDNTKIILSSLKMSIDNAKNKERIKQLQGKYYWLGKKLNNLKKEKTTLENLMGKKYN